MSGLAPPGPDGRRAGRARRARSCTSQLVALQGRRCAEAVTKPVETDGGVMTERRCRSRCRGSRRPPSVSCRRCSGDGRTWCRFNAGGSSSTVRARRTRQIASRWAARSRSRAHPRRHERVRDRHRVLYRRRQGARVSGHPMFQTGSETYAPVSTASVHAVIPSSQSAFVMATAMTTRSGRSPVIASRRSRPTHGLRTPTIPMDISITTTSQAPQGPARRRRERLVPRRPWTREQVPDPTADRRRESADERDQLLPARSATTSRRRASSRA